MLLATLLPICVFLNVAWAQDLEDAATTHPSFNIIEGDLGEKELPTEFYVKVHSYLSKTAAFENFTLEDTIHHVKEVDSWKAPKELQRKFPYYLSGYDYKDQPVWIGEIGKYNVREQIQKGPEAARNLTLYLFQGIHRIYRSMWDKDTPEKEIRTAFFIGDCEGLDLNQATHIPTVSYVLGLMQKHSDFLALMVGHVVVFNVNYIATLAFDSLRPVLGGVFDKIELHGGNKEKWQGALQKQLPNKVIPTWYGGSKDYKPLQVFG